MKEKILIIALAVLATANAFVWTKQANRDFLMGRTSEEITEVAQVETRPGEPYHLLYVDASDADHCRISLADTISEWLMQPAENEREKLVYVSSGEDPLYGIGEESRRDVLMAIAGGINPEPPVADFDVIQVLHYQDTAEIYKNTSQAYLSFVFSEAVHALSGEEIIKPIAEQFIRNHSLKRLRIYITGDLPEENKLDFIPQIEYVYFTKLKEPS